MTEEFRALQRVIAEHRERQRITCHTFYDQCEQLAIRALIDRDGRTDVWEWVTVQGEYPYTMHLRHKETGETFGSVMLRVPVVDG